MADPESFVSGGGGSNSDNVFIYFFYFFFVVVDKVREDKNTTKSRPSSAHQRNVIEMTLSASMVAL